MFRVTIATSEKEREDAFYVRRKVFVEEQGIPLSLELDELDHTADHFVVYDEQGMPIGAGRIRESEPFIAKVERICILPNFRGKNLGVRIMQSLEDHARNKGYKKMILNAQSYLISFYEKLGYTITSPEFMDADIPHRAMEKIISQ